MTLSEMFSNHLTRSRPIPFRCTAAARGFVTAGTIAPGEKLTLGRLRQLKHEGRRLCSVEAEHARQIVAQYGDNELDLDDAKVNKSMADAVLSLAKAAELRMRK